MTTALDIIKGALRRINSYQPGDQLSSFDESDCLETLNDLLDSWSIDKLQVFGSNENILQWIVGQNQYKIGNPTCTSLGEPPMSGTITSGSFNVLGVNIPADVVAGTSANQVGAGSTLTDSQNLIPSGTYVVAVGMAYMMNTDGTIVTNPDGTPVTIASPTALIMSQAATGSSQGLDVITYTIPGDFPIPRPLRITNGFTRINTLDFTIEVTQSQDRFLEILYKAQPGPWPTVAWYNNQMPYGILNVYQTPGQGGYVHLYTDTILTNLALTQVLVVPQGYVRALKWCLAKEICGEYGFPLTEQIKTNAAESLNMVKAINAKPAVVSKYDRELVRGNRPDGGWILTGGMR